MDEEARAYAARHGTTLTGALDRALDKAISEDDVVNEREFETWYAQLPAFQEDVAKLPDSGLTEQDIMGWDEHGLPT